MGRAEAGPAPLRVQVVWGPEAAAVEVVDLLLPPQATVADALAASGLLQRLQAAAPPLRVGVWGKPCALDRTLRDQDRVELYRGLRVDPKEARRQRYRKHAAGQPLNGNRKR